MTQTMPFTTDDTVARLAVRVPAASRVFMRYDLDFCCGGNRRLVDACKASGLDADVVLAEIVAASRGATAQSWEERPLPELIDHILAVHHRPLDEELPRLVVLAETVRRVHGDKDPERLGELTEVVRQLAEELACHMQKEEQILFPWICSGRGNTAGGPIAVMRSEHDACATMLTRIRQLTDEFTPPRAACTTWRALYLGLQDLDADLRQHMHLENNVLFPRALAG